MTSRASRRASVLDRFEVGVMLPSPAVQQEQKLSVAQAARHAEDAGLDLVAHGDHLAAGTPSLDVAVALAAAAAATDHLRIMTALYVPALRPLVWAAQQIAGLQQVSGGRLVLGVGAGGRPAQWAAAGVPYEERSRRTDSALRLLPRLLAGERVPLPYETGGPEAELAPPVAMPPVWVGGSSPAAVRRAARLGDGWFPSLTTPAEVAVGAVRLAELSAGHGRPAPAVTIGAAGALGEGAGLPSRAQLAANGAAAFGTVRPPSAEAAVTGSVREAAERLHSYCGAGATRVVMAVAGGDWRGQVELLARVRELLR